MAAKSAPAEVRGLRAGQWRGGGVAMKNEMDRREFLKYGAAGTVGMSSMGHSFGLAAAPAAKPLRLGIVGVGNRGTSHVETLLAMGSVQIPALCDINEDGAKGNRYLPLKYREVLRRSLHHRKLR
jgi:hypothetical protein